MYSESRVTRSRARTQGELIDVHVGELGQVSRLDLIAYYVLQVLASLSSYL